MDRLRILRTRCAALAHDAGELAPDPALTGGLGKPAGVRRRDPDDVAHEEAELLIDRRIYAPAGIAHPGEERRSKARAPDNEMIAHSSTSSSKNPSRPPSLSAMLPA